MNNRSRSRTIVWILIVVAISSLLITATVSANHRTAMELCASHGLGPNFEHAEGADSLLIRCLETIDTSGSHSESTAKSSISYRDTVALCASYGLGPNFEHAEGADSLLIRCIQTMDTSN